MRLPTLPALSLTATLCGLLLTAPLPAFATARKGGAAAQGKHHGTHGGKTHAPELPTKSFDPISEPNPGAQAPGGAQAAAPSGAPPPTRGPTRLDFDDRLIQGQSNKSGAVYLYDRKELKNRSMVKKRDSFRSEIISTVYDTE